MFSLLDKFLKNDGGEKAAGGLIQKVNSFKLSDSDVNLNVKWDDFLWENVIKKLSHLLRLLTRLDGRFIGGEYTFFSPSIDRLSPKYWN